MKDWSNREIELLRKHYPNMPTPKLSKLLGRSVCSVRTKAVKIGVHKIISSNNPYTQEKKKLLSKLYPNTKNIDIAKILGVTEGSVIAAGFRFKLRKSPEFLRLCSEKGFYKKGQSPVNKGRKQSEWMRKEMIERTKATRFKKGTIPPNHKPVGYERVSKDGYIEIKVSEGMRQFRLKHRVVYEQHFGAIPKGHNVEFKDRNKMNFDPSNLVLRTRKENMKLNSVHSLPKEIADTIQMLGAMQRQINKRNKQTA